MLIFLNNIKTLRLVVLFPPRLLIEELVAAKESGRPEDEWRAASQAYLAALQSR